MDIFFRYSGEGETRKVYICGFGKRANSAFPLMTHYATSPGKFRGVKPGLKPLFLPLNTVNNNEEAVAVDADVQNTMFGGLTISGRPTIGGENISSEPQLQRIYRQRRDHEWTWLV